MPYEPISNFILKTEAIPEDSTSPTGEIIETTPPILPKDFDTWNEKKKALENSERETLCKPREVWWCSLGLNIGKEQDGKNEDFERPVLIVRTLSEDTCLCVPLTSSPERHFFRILLPSFSSETKAIISQVRTISSKRLSRYMGNISEEDHHMIKKALHKLIKKA